MNFVVCHIADLVKLLAHHKSIPLRTIKACGTLIATMTGPQDIAKFAGGFLDLAFDPTLPRDRLIDAYIGEIATDLHHYLPRDNENPHDTCLLAAYRVLLASLRDRRCTDADIRQALDHVRLRGNTSYIDEDVRTDAPLQLITPRGMALIDRCLEVQTEESFYRIGFRPRGEGDPSIPFGEARHETFEDAISALKALFPN